MSILNQLLDSLAPPRVPEGLAQRAAAAAVQQPQERGRAPWPWGRGERRGGWKRAALAGSAAVGLAFTSAVAAEVVSGGRIEIPVVHEVVEAIPVLKPQPRAKADEHKQLAARPMRRTEPAANSAAQPQAQQSAADARRQQLMQRFGAIKQRVEERRAAGLPTPRADRIERQAKRIVQQRQARGLATPPVEQVEIRLALREARIARVLRQIPSDPAAISDLQVEQFARILPPRKRERFLALGPDMQRQTMIRLVQRLRARRMQQVQQLEPPTLQPPQQP